MIEYSEAEWRNEKGDLKLYVRNKFTMVRLAKNPDNKLWDLYINGWKQDHYNLDRAKDNGMKWYQEQENARLHSISNAGISQEEAPYSDLK